jgi:hypothetical protein
MKLGYSLSTHRDFGDFGDFGNSGQVGSRSG